MKQSRTFRVFVSSTFADLKAERDALQREVFPRLRDLCARNGCRFQAIDLRWGVSGEAALDQQTMNICLSELHRCQQITPRPNFLILLGDRYGWIPLPPQIDAAEFERLLQHVPDSETSLLVYDERHPETEQQRTGWYRRDENAVPPQYILRPRHMECPEDASDTQRHATEQLEAGGWAEIESRLRKVLLDAIAACPDAGEGDWQTKYEASATHQEIIHGAMALPDEREHVFAFFRNIRNRATLPAGSEFVDAGTERIDALKETIRETSGVTVHDYDATWNGSNLEYPLPQLCDNVYESLRRIIEEEIGKLEELPALTREIIAHQEFAAERRQNFIGRREMLEAIDGYLQGENPSPLVVYGPSGCGKSALLAQAAQQAADRYPGAYILQRFIGATPASTNITTLLRDLCLEIYDTFNFAELKERELAGAEGEAREQVRKKYDIPDEYRLLSEQFRAFLSLVPAEHGLILLLDALDQLSPDNNAHALHWLPTPLLAHVRLVVSVLEREGDAAQCLRAAETRFPPESLQRVGEMTSADGEGALSAWLAEAGRALTAEQRRSLLAGFARCPLPLYLKLACTEALRWKSFDGVLGGADDVPGLADDIPGIIGDLFARLEDRRQHGPALVRSSLGYLTAARHGLSETEMLALLSADPAVMADLRARSRKSPDAEEIPAVVWLRLYHDLAPYLLERAADNTALLGFYHRQFGEAAQTRYWSRDYHSKLADFFVKQPLWLSVQSRLPNHRKCAEQLYQQTESDQMWIELAASLTDLDFVDAKSKAGMVYDLVVDYNRIEWHKEKERRERSKAYADKVIAYSADPDNVPFPDPPETVPFRPPKTINEQRGDWTFFERVKAWEHFVGTHIRRLADGDAPVFQMAWNSADSGPVAERAADLERESNGFTGEWLRLRNPPPFILNLTCLRILEGHTDGVKAIMITPDSRRAVSGSEDNTLRVWNLETGESRVLSGHRDVVWAVAITPDGRRALSGSGDSTLRVWDLETGESWALEGHTRVVFAVSITPDGRRALSGSGDSTLRAWDLETGESRVLCGHGNGVWAVAITPDGRSAVSGSGDSTLRVWDLETGEERAPEEITAGVTAVTITPDGRRAITRSRDNTLRVWELATGESRLLVRPTLEELAVVITPDGRCRAVKGWNYEKCMLSVLYGSIDEIWVDLITPDGGRYIFLDSGFPHMWKMQNGGTFRALPGHTDRVKALSITPDGRCAVSGSADQSLRVWDLETGECRNILAGHTHSVNTVAITPDGCRAVSGGEDNTLRVWDLETGKCINILAGHTQSVYTVAITPDGRRVMSGSATDQSLLVCLMRGSEEKNLRVWDLETGKCINILAGHTQSVYTVAITPDGHRTVSGSKDKTLRLWNLETGECITVCSMGASVSFIVVHGLRLVVGNSGNRVNIFNIENYHLGRPVVTAARLWLFERLTWDNNLTAKCYWCGTRFVVKDNWIGQEIACPLDGCSKPLKLNPFVCDNSDWLR